MYEGGSEMKKKLISIRIIIVVGILIAGIYFLGSIFNPANGWVYIKINDKTYVANSAEIHNVIKPKQIGATQYKTLPFLKPTKNSGSNGFSYGLTIYEGDTQESIFIEQKNGYLKLNSTSLDNWEDGVKMKVKDNQLIES